MKAYRVELLIIDHNNLGEREIWNSFFDSDFPDECISQVPMNLEEAEIGEWSNNHPLNNPQTIEAEYERLFGIKNEQEL